jgi:hypothetical protein
MSKKTQKVTKMLQRVGKTAKHTTGQQEPVYQGFQVRCNEGGKSIVTLVQYKVVAEPNHSQSKGVTLSSRDLPVVNEGSTPFKLLPRPSGITDTEYARLITVQIAKRFPGTGV